MHQHHVHPSKRVRMESWLTKQSARQTVWKRWLIGCSRARWGYSKTILRTVTQGKARPEVVEKEAVPECEGQSSWSISC